jgi:toxin ParE1/3/4
MLLKVSKRALRDLSAAAAWWRANRPAAPDLFDEEVERALTLIEAQPLVAQEALDSKLKGVRRIVLQGTRYLLYYRVREERSEVEVLRLWHASRSPPKKL